MRDRHAANGKFRGQCADRQVGLFGEPGQQPVADLTRENRRTMTADLAGNLPTPRTLPLTDPHGRSNRNPKPLRRSPNRFTFPQRNGNTHPEVYRKWCNHALPLHLVDRVNHNTVNRGIPFPIQSCADML